MNNIDFQKEVATKILHKLEGADPHAILAGGAPRDWFFNKPATDLDFYIHLPKATTTYEEMRFERLGLEVKRMEWAGSLGEEYKCMEQLARIYEGIQDGVPYQVMVMREGTHTSVVPNFGASVCKAWWKGGEVKTTLDFLLSHSMGVIFKKDDYTAKEKHIQKMQTKYPAYQVVDYKCFDSHLQRYARRKNIYPHPSRIIASLMEDFNE